MLQLIRFLIYKGGFNVNNKVPKLQVSLRGGFSDRNGIKTENTQMQYDNLDERTRTAISNEIYFIYKSIFDNGLSIERKQDLWVQMLSEVYTQSISFRTFYEEKDMFEIIKQTIISDTYDIVLTLLEFLINKFNEFDRYKNGKAKERMNKLFKREYVGYRYTDGKIVPITDEQEIDAIEEAISSPFQKSADHLKKALNLFSDRDNPDYSNSIKESISAVEATCSEILGESKSLGAALDKLDKKGINIHPSLKAAFDKLFGYTSNASGIRHSGQLEGKDATFDEAKFMLISCSAFVNYLKGIVSTRTLN